MMLRFSIEQKLDGALLDKAWAIEHDIILKSLIMAQIERWRQA